ncbi:hypothetical protein [Tunicatimonas pelagia]|uniref:hypothetical protein n=1 Tax=Tunicatimonas pelagia TaxID=931531 RepID=UPI0026666792|nr:hypothetical protein [Tunicatimonas pelagia]WKN43819.1 hypothetical protein P0M28_02390 [Tunicatimonas pelagia]
MEVLSDKLLRILSNPKNISADDQEILEEAIAQYPYFQLARTLVAKAKHDQQTPDAYESLGSAAIYAPDRRHLRKVFYEDIHIDWQPTEAKAIENTPTTAAIEDNSLKEESTAVDPFSVTEQTGVSEESSTEAATSEETSLTDSTPETIKISEESNSDEAGAEKPEVESFGPNATDAANSNTANPEIEKSGVANHDEEEEIVYQELEENLRKLRQAKKEAQQEEADKKKIVDTTKVSSESVHTEVSVQSPLLIDYLHDIEPISSERLGIHQQKQNELINRFVNSDTTSVGRPRPNLPDSAAETSDLSEKSATYDTDLVTENLAEIMLKQGKKGKAIKIYRQLMLKFPEKKAYFAEKIEKLNEI